MNFRNCMLIAKKDWKTTVRNKEIFLPMVLLPLFFSIVFPIIMIWSALIDPKAFINSFGDKEQLVSSLNIPETYNDHLIAVTVAVKSFILPYFLFTPIIATMIISADSFAGEKERKTMESLALLPISKSELIIGKILAAFLPSMAISLIYFCAFGIEVNLLAIAYLEGNILIFLDLSWIFMIFLFIPSLSFFNILIGVIISSRSKNFKNAQSKSGFLITPVILLLFTQILNPAFMSPLMILVLSGFLGILCVAFVKLGKNLLDIEKLILML